MARRINAKLVLQLRVEGMTGRAIALAQGMSRKSVLAVFDAAEKAGIGSDGYAGRSDAEVYALLFPGRAGPGRAGANTRVCSCSLIGAGCTKSSPRSG